MKISDLVNKVEPFKFEYDGFTLEGEFYKYRTTTPSYAKKALASLPEIPENANNGEREAAEKARLEANEKLGAKALADTIKSWSATDDDDNPVAPSLETFESLPTPFTTAFLKYLASLREGSEAEKKESANSPSS